MVRQCGDFNPLTFSDIASAATECLRKSHYKVLSRVSCEYCHGVLYLRGRLFSFHEKQIAQQAVAAVNGVKRVVNEIRVY
jgi:osmotically-inducible protein OsmY